jgi:hypothetical protein
MSHKTHYEIIAKRSVLNVIAENLKIGNRS